jgi:hypothetical protein
MLVLAIGVIACSFLLEAHSDQRVAFRFLPDYPLPETCLAHSMFGVSCPGCGLTRSFIYLAHGDWQTSLKMHRLGWLLALAILFQLPYRFFCLAKHDCSLTTLAFFRWFGYLLIALLLGNWLYQIIFVG